MSTFKYKAIKQDGKQETGVLEAPNKDILINTLQQRGLIVLNVSESRFKEKKDKVYTIKAHSKVTSNDLIQFASQLTTILKANIPLLRAFDIQIQQTTSRQFKTILSTIKDNVSKGRSLKDALAQYPKVFSRLWVNLIETGETSGNLPMVLEFLTDYLRKAQDLKRKTMTALIYPAILTTVSVLAIYIFTIFVIPVFVSVFDEFNIDLPLVTKIVMGTSKFLRNNVLLTIITLAVGGYLFYRYYNTDSGQKRVEIVSYKLPVFGNFLLNMTLEKFSSSLGLLTHSGIPILQSLEIIARTSTSKLIQEAVQHSYADVSDGKSLSNSLSKSNMFPPMTLSMISVGEETGELDTMLDNVTEHYRKELTIFAERLSATLEPVMIVIMGAIVFILVLSVYLPIFNLTLLGGKR